MKLRPKRSIISKLQNLTDDDDESVDNSEYEPSEHESSFPSISDENEQKSSFDSSSSKFKKNVISNKIKVSTPNHEESSTSDQSAVAGKNKRKRCISSESSISSDDGLAVTKREKHQHESSVANSSLDVSINLKSVGPVLKNKKNEILKTSQDGTKKNTCYYCYEDRQKTNNPNLKVHYAKLPDHYVSAHKNEKEIKELMKIPITPVVLGQSKTANQLKREAILEKLRNDANHINNLEATDVAHFIPARRPPEGSGKTVADKGSCYKCHKSLSKSSLHKHVRKCTGLSFKNRHEVQASSRATIGDYSSLATEGAIQIISKMREDEFLDEIRYDDAIFYWLNSEASKQETRKIHDKIRANLKRLGKLKLQMRILSDEIDEFSDIFHEDHYDIFIEACKILGKQNPDDNYLESSSTAAEMSFLIKNVATIYHVMIGKDQKEKREEIDAFLKKVSTLWHSSIGNTIAETQARNRRNKIVTLPTKDDISKLREFLEKEMATGYNSLRIQYSDTSYIQLSNSIESYLHVTNCRRAGEVEKLSVEDFNVIQASGNNCRIQVRGKRTKPVPIVFDRTVLKYLKLLISNRLKARISQKNPYIFSTIQDVSKRYKFFSACTLMTKFSELCGAEDPESLRGTLFRKQLATEGMKKGINERTVETLSTFMGHTPRIHIQNYRQSVLQKDVAMSDLVRVAQTSKTTSNEKRMLQNDVVESEQVHDMSIEQDLSIELDKKTEPDQSADESIDHDQHQDENDQNASNHSISSAKVHYKKSWTRATVNVLMAYFPNALDSDYSVPSGSEIRRFLKTVKNDPNYEGRTEPQIRAWFHANRKKPKNDTCVPSRNNIPTYIYAKFQKYIDTGEIPSNKTCGKFLSQSPSKSNLSIKNIQDWVQQAIRRKSRKN